MGIGRRWVLPILRIVVFAAIAAALVKLAFFGGLTAASDGAVPTGEVSDPTTQVENRTITNTVTVDATVLADAAAPIRSTVAGSVVKVLAAKGATVAATTPIATVKVTLTRADGTPYDRVVTLTAGAAGVLSALDLLPQQTLAVGDTIGQVAPPTFNVSGSIRPEQQYRLLDRPTTATVRVTGGPQPFECTGLTISAPLAGESPAGSNPGTADAVGGASGSGTSGGTTVRCAVPAGVTVFSGLAAKVAIPGGRAEKVPALPATAVEGTAGGDGAVYLPGSKGADPEKKPVKLGLTDGRWVQIASGLTASDQVLLYVPGRADEAAATRGPGYGG